MLHSCLVIKSTNRIFKVHIGYIIFMLTLCSVSYVKLIPVLLVLQNITDGGYIITSKPYIPALPDDDNADLVLNALGEPTLSSLGLCNYTPAGLLQYLLESIHVSLDVPWFTAIILGNRFLVRCHIKNKKGDT